ncbi:hypothetical protein CPC08DRAFT_764623 [Agrocybe pediades]|nr:hypothetical protein CPC08DRAFT_764623 [Agrocybe pediades]
MSYSLFPPSTPTALGELTRAMDKTISYSDSHVYRVVDTSEGLNKGTAAALRSSVLWLNIKGASRKTTRPISLSPPYAPRLMSSGPPQVFIDDSDPNIVYSGQNAWVAQKGILTVPQAVNLPSRAPFYGTVHKIQENGTLSYIYTGSDVSAFFKSRLEDISILCIIDENTEGALSSFSQPDEVLCRSNGLHDGQHNITISVSPSQHPQSISLISPYFDGLFYTPSKNATDNTQAQELDLTYTPEQALSVGMKMTSGSTANTLSLPGDAIDFDFNGTSLAMYVTYINGKHNDVTLALSYNVDGGPALNFTLENPPLVGAFSGKNQLILQTPQYAFGQHRLHLDFFGPATTSAPDVRQRGYLPAESSVGLFSSASPKQYEDVKDRALALDVQANLTTIPTDPSFSLDYIFVQNAPGTRELALVPFPPVPSSSSTTSTAQPTPPTASPTNNTSTLESTSHHTIPRYIVAIAATLSTLFTLLIFSVLYIKRRSLRRRFSSRDNSNAAKVNVTPFIPGIFARRAMYPASKRMLASMPDLPHFAENVSKANRLVPQGRNPTRAAELSGPVPALVVSLPVPAAVPSSHAADDAEEPIYRIHEDGGSVHDASSNAPRQRQVIDLPPLYNSNFGHRPEPTEDSNRGAD